MRKQVEVENKGSSVGVATVKSAIHTLKEDSKVKITEPIFNKVVSKLRTEYAGILLGRQVTVNYGNYEISLK